MQVVIIEDEIPAADSLQRMLSAVDPEIEVIAVLRNNRDARNFFGTAKKKVDIVFLDIQLAGERSLDLLQDKVIDCPVIFVTAHDDYLMEALQYTSMDYVLKPISRESIERSLRKYELFKTHFRADLGRLSDFLGAGNAGAKKSRILVKKGGAFQFVRTDDIACFFRDDRIVFLCDGTNNKYLTELNDLTTLEDSLDPRRFFRANRKFIINLDFIKSFRMIDRVKLLVELKIPLRQEIIISQQTASKFKDWISEKQ